MVFISDSLKDTVSKARQLYREGDEDGAARLLHTVVDDAEFASFNGLMLGAFEEEAVCACRMSENRLGCFTPPAGEVMLIPAPVGGAQYVSTNSAAGAAYAAAEARAGALTGTIVDTPVETVLGWEKCAGNDDRELLRSWIENAARVVARQRDSGEARKSPGATGGTAVSDSAAGAAYVGRVDELRAKPAMGSRRFCAKRPRDFLFSGPGEGIPEVCAECDQECPVGPAWVNRAAPLKDARETLVAWAESGRDDLDRDETVRGLCNDLLDAAQVDTLGGCPLCQQ